jgi:3-deoxy-D-manno-octulosonate 8-phosphate phosphatase (KDO 8-P phosphatase)
LKFDFLRHDIKNKQVEYLAFKERYNLNDSNIVYIGDDIIDLPILTKCGLSFTPKDARYYIRENVDIVTTTKGAEGVFRDIADYILESQNLLDKIIENFKK